MKTGDFLNFCFLGAQDTGFCQSISGLFFLFPKLIFINDVNQALRNRETDATGRRLGVKRLLLISRREMHLYERGKHTTFVCNELIVHGKINDLACNALWARITKNPDCGTGPLLRSLVHSFTRTAHSFNYSLRSFAHSFIARLVKR